MLEQTRHCLRNIQRNLEAAGATMADVVWTTVYTTDIREFRELVAAREAFFRDHLPTGTNAAPAMGARYICCIVGVQVTQSVSETIMRTLTAAFAFALGSVLAPSAIAASPTDMDVKVQIVDDEVRTNASFFVRAPQQRVWDVITDYERTPQYMRDTVSSKIISRSGDSLRLAQKDQVKFGPFSIPIETVRDVKHVEPMSTESHIVSGSFKKYDAKIELVPESGGTRVIYRSQTIPDSALASFAGASTIKKHTEERFQQLRTEILRRELLANSNASR